MRGPVLLISCVLAICAPARAEVTTDEDDPVLPEELHPVEESPRDLHWGRMFAEAGVLFGILEGFYWLDKDANSFDFKYQIDGHNLRERFITFKAWSLDDNYFNTNGWRHTAQGGLNYLFARSNGFSSVQSYVVSLGLSAAWEFFGEFKEEVSFNDLVMTPRSGAVVAESVWQLGVFLLRGRPNWFNQIAGNALTGGRGLFDRIDRKPSFHSDNISSLGLDRDIMHRFELSLVGGSQHESNQPSQGIVRMALETELIMIPGFDRPGRGRQLRTAPSFTQMRVEATRNDEEIVDFRALARAAVTVWHRKNIGDDGDGWNLLYGLSSAYEYGFHASTTRDTKITRDRVAIAHLLGPTLDLTVRTRGLRMRAIVDVYANWGLLRPFAMNAHRELFPDDEVRSTIVRDNYYHALGVTGAARIQLGFGPITGGVSYQRDHFKSVQGIDRHQEDLVEDFPLFDERGEGRLWTRYAIDLSRDLALEVELSAELRDRSGHVKETELEEQERRYLAGVQLAF
jgi:hypothetical protein